MCRGKNLRRCVVPASLFALAFAVIAGCQEQMSNQPRYEPLETSPLLTAGTWSRKPVAGTIARGELQLDEAYFTGKVQGKLVTELPERALASQTLSELVGRGRLRYNVYCSHCHGQVGGGTGGDKVMLEAVGMVVKRGFPVPPTYHQERLRLAPIGHFFDVITNGLGRMAPHGYLVPAQDRWAISAYIRALQLSQYAPRADMSQSDISKLATTTPPDENREPQTSSSVEPEASATEESQQ